MIVKKYSVFIIHGFYSFFLSKVHEDRNVLFPLIFPNVFHQVHLVHQVFVSNVWSKDAKQVLYLDPDSRIELGTN